MEDQPMPKGGKANVSLLVIFDVLERCKTGYERYKTPLMSMNGRDSAIDAYQELLDMLFYIRQMIVEWEELRNAAKTLAETGIGLEDDAVKNAIDALARMGVIDG